MSKAIRLENWAMVGSDPYKPPECQTFRLAGEVYGHSKHKDGQHVKTSSIIGRNGELIKTYSGSLYELGKVDPEYEALFPNAKERLLARIEQVTGQAKRKRRPKTRRLDEARNG